MTFCQKSASLSTNLILLLFYSILFSYQFCSSFICYQRLYGHCPSWGGIWRAFLSALGAIWFPIGAPCYFASFCFYCATMQQTKRSNIDQPQWQTTCSGSNTKNLCTAQLSNKRAWLLEQTFTHAQTHKHALSLGHINKPEHKTDELLRNTYTGLSSTLGGISNAKKQEKESEFLMF